MVSSYLTSSGHRYHRTTVMAFASLSGLLPLLSLEVVYILLIHPLEILWMRHGKPHDVQLPLSLVLAVVAVQC